MDKEIKRLRENKKDVYLLYTIEKKDKKSINEVNNYILKKLIELKFNKFYSLEKTLDRDLYFYDSVHYTKEGHKKVSEKILSILN